MTGELASLSEDVRIEHDMLGELPVPRHAMYGIHTARAVSNFPGRGPLLRDFPELCRGLALVKLAALYANLEHDVIDPELAHPLAQACREIADDAADLRAWLIVPMLQGGAGTSSNMNVNEVLANRALVLIGRAPGDYASCHPNDQVNRSQSTNDVYPSALRVALLEGSSCLAEALAALSVSLRSLAERADDLLKLARTQLRDAVPMPVSAEVEAWAARVEGAQRELERSARGLHEVNLGGTAVGTGAGAPEGFAVTAVAHLRRLTGLAFTRAADPVAATTDTSAQLVYSAALRATAVALNKVCNDLRLLSSGPRTGLGEYRLPPVQAGSSLMPGKVNPVMCEYVNAAVLKVLGLDLTTTLALDAGELQLNAMLPAAAQAMLESQTLLADAAYALSTRCIDDVQVDAERVRVAAGAGLGRVTELAQDVGYERASALAVAEEKLRRAEDSAPTSTSGGRRQHA